MNLHFYIIAKGRRKLHFDNVELLEQFIFSKKNFTTDAKIVVMQDSTFGGEILVKRYIEISNENKKQNIGT